MGKENANSSTIFEFAVNMTCGNCETAVRKALSSVSGISSIKVDVAQQRVLVTSNQSFSTIQNALETTGMLAVLRGQGQGQQHLGAAISIVKAGKNVLGLVRFTQTSKETCVVDYSFNGLAIGKYDLNIHEFGDLSEGCQSTGEVYDSGENQDHTNNIDRQRVGVLGCLVANSEGSAVFRYENSNLKIWDIIGRSVVLHEKKNDFLQETVAGKALGCGIIARSSGLFENKKMVCTCTGKTIWEERKEAREKMG